MSYIDQDTLDQCREALRLGCQLEYLAGKLRCTPEYLARLLGLPSKPAPNMVEQPADYLWAYDDAKGVL